MRAFVRRWWIFGTLPLGAAVGLWSGSLELPEWMVALYVVAVTLVVCAVLVWRMKVWKRQAREELIASLYQMPVYLISDMWEAAVRAGLVDPKILAEIRREQAERRAAERAQESQGEEHP